MKSITNIRCMYRTQPIGIDTQPILTWICNGFVQKKCRIELQNDDGAIVYDTGWLEQGFPSVFLEMPLNSKTRYFYTISAEDTQGGIITSAVDFFETGLLSPEDCYAQWITANHDAPVFRKTFRLPNGIKKARIYYSGLGYSYLYINGKAVHDYLHSPVWSDYHERDLSSLLYPLHDSFSHSTYYIALDVIDFLHEGENLLSVALGNGFYNQKVRDVEGKMQYGSPKLFLQLEVETDTGLLQIGSDDSFEWTESPVTFNNIFRGEVYDARLKNDCHSITFNGASHKAELAPTRETTMRAQFCPPDRIIRKISPVLISEHENKRIYDLGENISGVIRICTSTNSGESILMRFAEELHENGELDFQSAGGEEQIQQDRYISDGTQNQEYIPMFAWHGFRYAEVTGDCEVTEALVIHTDVNEAGAFHCDHDGLNFIFDAYRRSQMTNLHSCIPSDCPHRERLGYTGDGQITADTAMFCFDMAAVYRKWMRDILDCQCQKSGHIQHTAPFAGGGGGPGGWGCAVIILPYLFWLHYGDIELLKTCYEPMCRWMQYLEEHSENHIVIREEEKGWCLGDWAFPVKDFNLSEALVNTYYYYKSAGMMQEIAKAVGRSQDAKRFSILQDDIKTAFDRAFYRPERHTYDSGRHAAAAFAFDMGLGGEKEKQELLAYYQQSRMLDTGIFGTPLLVDYLIRSGKGALAIEMLTAKNAPSYGWMQVHGATTLWEYFFDGFSHNHPMFGSVVGVFIRTILGIDPTTAHPGFQKLTLSPHFDCGLLFAEGFTETPFGRITVRWERGEKDILYAVEIPYGIDAEFSANGITKKLHVGNNTIVIPLI